MGNMYVWVAIAILALIIDIATSSFFFAGFTIGGVFAIIAWILKASTIVQIMVFGLTSGIAIAAEYQWFRKKVKKTIPAPPGIEEKYLGKIITAEEDIESGCRMKVEGIYWAVENAGEKIYKGEKAKIIGISGNKLVIKK